MAPEREAPVCVYCRRHPIDPRWRPFCSQRCQLLDLAAWADGAYQVPGTDADSTDPDSQENHRQD